MQLQLGQPSIYATAGINAWWVGGSSNVTTQSAILPPGSQAGALTLSDTSNNNAMVLSNTYTPQSGKTMACRFYRVPTGSGGLGGNVMEVCKNVGSGHINPAACVAVFDSGTQITDGFLGGDSPNILAIGPVIPSGQWHHLEMQVVLGTASNASITLYLDGNPVPFMSVTGVSLQYATSDCHTFYADTIFTPPIDSSLGSAFVGYITDDYVFDNTGPAPWNGALAPLGLGGAKTGFAFMGGPGVTSAWTPNGAATDWQCTNTVPPGATPYASSSTVGQTFFGTLTALPTASAIIGAQISTFAAENTGGARAIQSGFSNGSTEVYSGTNRFLATSPAYFFDEYETNPVTSLPWSPADVATLQIGEQLTV